MRSEPSRAHLAVFLAALCYLPVVLVWTGVIPFAYRFYVLIAMTAVMAAYAALVGLGWKELGFRRDTLRGSMVSNGIVSAVLLLLLVGSYLAGSIMCSSPARPRNSSIAASFSRKRAAAVSWLPAYRSRCQR